MELWRYDKEDGVLIKKSNLEVHMKCYRCSGPMVYQKFYGPQEDFWGWRCIFCGEIIDHVILENRQSSRGRSTTNGRTWRR